MNVPIQQQNHVPSFKQCINTSVNQHLAALSSHSRSKSKSNMSNNKTPKKSLKNKKKQSTLNISPNKSAKNINVSGRRQLQSPLQIKRRESKIQSQKKMKYIINMKNQVTLLEKKLIQTENNLKLTQNQQKPNQTDSKTEKLERRVNKIMQFLEDYEKQIVTQTHQIGQSYLAKADQTFPQQQIKIDANLFVFKKLPQPDFTFKNNLQNRMKDLQRKLNM